MPRIKFEDQFDPAFTKELEWIESNKRRFLSKKDYSKLDVEALLSRLELARLMHGMSMIDLRETDSFVHYAMAKNLQQWRYWKRIAARNVGIYGEQADCFRAEIRSRLTSSSPEARCPVRRIGRR